jgi:riboflavin synthase
MFTGLVEGIGTISKLQQRGSSIVFTVTAPKLARGIRMNESVAINGVCLTVIGRTSHAFTVQAVEETLKKTNLGELVRGSVVNLERALLPTERLGGHFVLGHVDGVGKVIHIEPRKSSWMVWFKIPKRFARYLIPVGSVAVDGVSLTVAELRGATFGVSIIPHTMEMTTFARLRNGSRVNIEFDVLGKYVERILKYR